MNTIITTEQEYDLALNRIDEIFFAKVGTPEYDEGELLSLLIEDYEKKHYPIEAPDPIAAIKIRMEDLGLKQVEFKSNPECKCKNPLYI